MADTDTARTAIEPIESATVAFKNLDAVSKQFGKSVTSALSAGVVGGKDLDKVLRGLGSSLSNVALKSAMKPLEGLLGSGVESLSKSLIGALSGGASVTANAMGNVFGGGKVRAFAQGGVVSSPTYFPMSGGLGLMGERGAEAVMPLARGPDGRLGVRTGGGGRPMNVTVNISTSDVQSFRNSEAQVSGALARAVARGRRAV